MNNKSMNDHSEALAPLNIAPDEFLSAFFAADETVRLRVFDDKKPSAFKGAKLECAVGGFALIADTLRRHNDQHRGVFFTVNHGGHEDAEIDRINAQFVECDSLTLDEQFVQIHAFPLPPSIIVRTAKSLHCYWLTQNAKVSDFRRIQKKLVARLHGDPVCINESRVFRLPGFNHCKGDPIPVVCVKFDPKLRYTQEELESVLPSTDCETTHPTSEPAPTTKNPRTGLSLVAKRCAFIRHCREHAETLPEALWYAMISNLAVFEGGDALVHELSSGYPHYDRAETQSKIDHFRASGTKPITCAKIVETGFQCPKMLDGSCACKAPAALCYAPVDLDTLRTLLADITVTNSTSDDLQTAQRFVRDYLYNADNVLATAFIDNEMRARFGLGKSDVRPLHTLYKKLYKSFEGIQSAKAARADAESNGELPPWYEPTDHGLRFMPDLLADYLVKNVEAFYTAGYYYVYENGVYAEKGAWWANHKVRSFMLPRHATMNQIKDACWQWNQMIHKPTEDINPNPYIINLRNGLYDVLESTLTEHTPAYLSTIQLRVNYNPSAQCPRFTQFLNEALDPNDIPIIQEVFGYCLVPLNKAQKAFVLIGEPGAGKSVLLLTLNQVLLGQCNVSNIPWQNLTDRFNKAELFGKLANIFADLPTKNIYDAGIFKALVGEDIVNAERKGKDPFSFQPTARLLFSCNSIPRNYGDKSEGFYRRLIIIRFSKSVPEKRRDPMLVERFKDEADGILLFALEGLKRLIANNFQFTESERSRVELDQYRVDSNSTLSFIADMCEIKPDAEIERMELYTKYREYCRTAGLTPYSQKAFHRDLEAHCPNTRRATDRLGRRRTWRGIQIVEGGVI